MSACPQAGCTGSVVDGYCDVCGMPPDTAIDAPSSADEATALADGAIDSGRSVASARLGSAAMGSARTGSSSTRRVRSDSQRVRSARLGAGLTTIPSVEPVDPHVVVKDDPAVPENKRSCSQCGAPVGRSVGGRPGREEGFCSKCGTQFSFSAKLTNGDLVGGQYLVAGALAHGGLGWIYLAQDRNVSDRWVVLKGLLNSADPDALAAAIAEQRFLARVDHPSIVQIYNFVTHDEAGYIVMEFVGGQSLKEILKNRMAANGGVYEPLPVDQALAYIIEILPAFQYLHDQGMVYCDFKPDNLIQVGDAVKLIDLGGVRHLDDDGSAIYGTVGYQAPEVPRQGTSVASDIYTIGRTLLVLCYEFRGYQTTYLHSLPAPADVPLFQQYDSLYWLIAKCCAPNPDDRFGSADELRAQALGVLREVVALAEPGAAQTTATSLYFANPAASTDRMTWDELPHLKPDPSDQQFAWLQNIAPGDPATRLQELAEAPAETAEVWLARGQEHLRAGKPAAAELAAQSMLQADPWDWRALWLSGLAALQSGNADRAQQSFNTVYQQVPGELAPKLALAVSCEAGGELDVAENLYRTCAETDGAYVAPAAFGLARVRVARDDIADATAALDMVPGSSRSYVESRRFRASLLSGAKSVDVGTLDAALKSIEGVSLGVTERETIVSRVLERALQLVTSSGPQQGSIGPFETKEPALRNALESSYRALAREALRPEDRIDLVNQANAVRAWTFR
ncbi:MAG: tetratricopeptide repeat protein [Propionibacteriaceae bacterium]|nr:tetratricopeptide repeat protein [Propionibacteriaceae bacterium]